MDNPSRILEIRGRQLDAVPIVQDTTHFRKALGDIRFLLRLLEGYEEAVDFYANPESYHGIGFMVDPPAGEFADDVSNHQHPAYPRPMPGAKARRALMEAAQLDKEEADAT
jgi:hypothetical protein